MSRKLIEQVPKERFDLLTGRYEKFKENLVDPEMTPVRVFDPLPQKLLDELELIREVSRELQEKKEEDIQKQAAQAESQAEDDSKVETEKTEETK